MYQNFIKRLLDITLAASLLAISFPLIVVIMIVVKVNSKGPIVFKQQRFGRYKEPFTIYKFRTMVTTAPANNPTNTFIDAKNYITYSGMIMRKLSLDELPQLVNVLKGEMSMVGPRPVVLTELNLIKERDKYGANNCKPGITGWAQVNGRDEIRMKAKAKMDGEYAKRQGFLMDVKCIMLTVWAVLSIKGHREGHDQSTNLETTE